MAAEEFPVRWGLIEEPSFAVARAEIDPNWRRFDLALSAIEWLIARHADDPLACPEVEPPIRLARATLDTVELQILRVWFRLDVREDKALLEWVDIHKPAPHTDDWQ